jgi:hypothetical protein
MSKGIPVVHPSEALKLKIELISAMLSNPSVVSSLNDVKLDGKMLVEQAEDLFQMLQDRYKKEMRKRLQF